MNYKSTSSFLAVMLCTAAPAFADKIPVGLWNGESISHHSEKSIHVTGSAIRFDSRDKNLAEAFMLVDSHLSVGGDQMALLALDGNHGHGFGKDAEKNRWKHKGKDRADGYEPIGAIAVPEPGAQMLLLFGLTGLGMLFYRRNSLKRAI